MDDPLAREMYQEHILELYKNPANFGELEGATHKHREHNPLCGDDITIKLLIKNGKVEDVKFSGRGCAISIAASSMVTDAVKGKSVDEVMKMDKKTVLEMLHIPIGPVRLKCALISLETVHKAVQGVASSKEITGG